MPRLLNRLLLSERHGALWGAIGVFVAVAALAAAYFVPWQIQSRVESGNIARLAYAVSIVANPPPGESAETTNYWSSTIQLWNQGKRTAETAVLHIHAPSPDDFLHSPPELVSAPPTATVKINERIPRGIYEVVLTNFTPGEYCAIRMAYRADGDVAAAVRRSRQEDLFSAQFARHFINQFWFTGENIQAENLGALDVPQTFNVK